MRRRNLIELFLSAAGASAFRVGRRRDRVAVVGGGVLGASIAYHLSRRGAQVTVLERTAPASGATANSFAWINASFGKQPYHYHRINRLSMLAYRHLERELGGAFDVRWGGSVTWSGDTERARRLRRQVRDQQVWGYGIHLIDEDEFHRLEPNVDPGPVIAAAHAEHEGSVDPVRLTKALLAKAEEAGARVVFPCEVTGFDMGWGVLRAVHTSCGEMPADVAVIAAGVDTPGIAAMAGLDVPLKDSPGILAHTAPTDRIVHRVVLSPGGHAKQKWDGRIVAGASFSGSPTTDASAERGERILHSVARFLPKLGEAQLERVTVGWRPLPADDHPIVGFSEGSPDVYVAVMHSGITLAPLMGRLASTEILDGVAVDLLDPYRLDRFARTEPSPR